MPMFTFADNYDGSELVQNIVFTSPCALEVFLYHTLNSTEFTRKLENLQGGWKLKSGTIIGPAIPIELDEYI